MISHEAVRRVAVTGLGVVAPNGSNLPVFWDSIVQGRSAAGLLTRFSPGDAPSRIACEVRDFEPSRFMESKVVRRLDLSLQYAVAAARMALTDSGLSLAALPSDRVGIVEGTTVSNNDTAARADEAWRRRGYRGISLFAMINGYSGGGSGEIAIELGVKGHAITLSSGSASGNDVMGYALGMIQNDEADVMIAGGAEAPILPQIWGTFCQGKVMTRNNDDPPSAMKPFDIARSGFVLGEGAGFLVMEELSHAIGRGARIYAEVIGHGRACEAYHPVAPEPGGIGVIQAIRRALVRAGVDFGEVDYINAHGTATETNDVVETRAIKSLFGTKAHRISISSTKPVTGHLMAAAGAVETVVTALAVHHQTIPPTANLRVPDPECDLDYVPRAARPYPIRVALNISSGFGGKNACLALRRWPSPAR
jgi:3-oxoacyl-[acyl-carrier-protein] synthase II